MMSKAHTTRAVFRTIMSGFWAITVLMSFTALGVLGGYNAVLGTTALVVLLGALALVSLLFVFNLTKVVAQAKNSQGAFWDWIRGFDTPLVNTITGILFGAVAFLGVVGYLFAQPYVIATGLVTAPSQIMFFALAALVTAVVFIADSTFFEDVSLTRAQEPDIDDEAVLRFAERMERAEKRAQSCSNAVSEEVDDTLVIEDAETPQNDPEATTAEIPIVPEPKPTLPY